MALVRSEFGQAVPPATPRPRTVVPHNAWLVSLLPNIDFPQRRSEVAEVPPTLETTGGKLTKRRFSCLPRGNREPMVLRKNSQGGGPANNPNAARSTEHLRSTDRWAFARVMPRRETVRFRSRPGSPSPWNVQR